jgi:hypothetical protein
VACGSQRCPTGRGGFCCFVVGNGSTQPPQFDCRTANEADCTFPMTHAACDGEEDCGAGEVCCGTFTLLAGLQVFSRIECASSCSGAMDAVICGEPSTSCPNGSCEPVLTLPPAYGICR